MNGLKIATHYGCHLIRPRKVVGFDNGITPVKFDALVEALGAVSVPWIGKHDCCGSPVWGVNDELSMDMTEKKLRNAHQGGAECLTVVCPYCQMQFGKIQKRIMETRGLDIHVPCVVYPQLLGLCLGIDSEALGLEKELPAAVTTHLHDIVEEPSALRQDETPYSIPHIIPEAGRTTEVQAD